MHYIYVFYALIDIHEIILYTALCLKVIIVITCNVLQKLHGIVH